MAPGSRLEAEQIPYAIIGAMALNAYGYRRVTEDVAVLLTAEGLGRLKERYLDRGYLERFPGSKGLRDTESSIDIDVVLAGDFPGDGKPKPVAFPDPATCAERGEKVALVPLEKLIELKLASDMTAPHRLRDLADVLERPEQVRSPRILATRLRSRPTRTSDAVARARFAHPALSQPA